MTRKAMVLGWLVLALAACKGEDMPEASGNASGEVLPGSASDAMLPLDTVTSQPPLAPKAEPADRPDLLGADRPSSRPAAEPSAKASAKTADAPASDE